MKRYMQIHRKTSGSRNILLLKFFGKLLAAVLLVFALLFLVDKINFPTPIKNIEKIITNENFKTIK